MIARVVLVVCQRMFSSYKRNKHKKGRSEEQRGTCKLANLQTRVPVYGQCQVHSHGQTHGCHGYVIQGDGRSDTGLDTRQATCLKTMFTLFANNGGGGGYTYGAVPQDSAPSSAPASTSASRHQRVSVAASVACGMLRGTRTSKPAIASVGMTLMANVAPPSVVTWVPCACATPPQDRG
jgi:hypothetical protein